MVEKSEVKLKTCPFCGGYPKTQQCKVQHCQLHGDPYQDWKIVCCFITIQKPTREECYKIWNTRIQTKGAGE